MAMAKKYKSGIIVSYISTEDWKEHTYFKEETFKNKIKYGKDKQKCC